MHIPDAKGAFHDNRHLDRGPEHAPPGGEGHPLGRLAPGLPRTLDHDQQDVILNAGDAFVTQAHHRVIAYALQTAVLRLEPLPCTRRATASRWRWLPQRRARGLAAA
jgi:hypothetical protein